MLESARQAEHGGAPDAALRQARRGQLDRALPGARHRAGVVRGLDLARVLRARARSDLQARVAQRRPRRAARRATGATSPRRSTSPARRSIVVRGTDGEVRAFHNICRHRGNKLVWNDFPRRGDRAAPAASSRASTTAGATTSTATCTFVQQEGEFFDLDKADYGLVPVHCDVWEGFIFVNLDADERRARRCASSSAR